MHLAGMDLTEQHQAADHHQALDVVVVAEPVHPPDCLIQGGQAGAAVVPAGGQPALVVPKVGAGLALAVDPIDAAHKLAPADHLA